MYRSVMRPYPHPRSAEYITGLAAMRGGIIVDFIGLPKNEFPFNIPDKYKGKGKQIMRHVLAGGNFGRKTRKTKTVGFKYKIETALYILRNSIKYFSLAPREMTMLFPWSIKENIKIYWNELNEKR